MEPITPSAMIGTVVGYLAKKLKDNASIQEFFSDFTSATVDWVKPLFLKDDGQPKEMLQQLQSKPDSEARQNVVKSTLEAALEDNATLEEKLKDLHKAVVEKSGLVSSGISNSGNMVNGPIHSGGTVIVGNNNNVNKP